VAVPDPAGGIEVHSPRDPTLHYATRRWPESRPPGLRLTVRRHPWYRLDMEPPNRWRWLAFPDPRYRFDSASGAFRVRYAGDTQRAAMRERFDDEGRIVSIDHLRLNLVELMGVVRVLDLRHDRNLDALGLDDQINTSRAPAVWEACHRLADQVHAWYGTRCDGIVYRSRTTPQRSANIAFFPHAPLTARTLGYLGDQTRLLAACVLSDGFAVEGW
jgi:hypothetical protein